MFSWFVRRTPDTFIILLAVSYKKYTATIICCILFVLVIIIQIIVFKKEFMRLKKIGDVL